jgi:5-bromo-4-chloroindolyl phosphate hydrolysis protein
MNGSPDFSEERGLDELRLSREHRDLHGAVHSDVEDIDVELDYGKESNRSSGR